MIKDFTQYDENTLLIVNQALKDAGMSSEEAISAVIMMQNRGILFRERTSYTTNDEFDKHARWMKERNNAFLGSLPTSLVETGSKKKDNQFMIVLLSIIAFCFSSIIGSCLGTFVVIWFGNGR